MSDAWIIGRDEDGERLYLNQDLPGVEAWVPWPTEASTFSHAGARAAIRALGPRPGEHIRAVRRFEAMRSSGGASA